MAVTTEHCHAVKMTETGRIVGKARWAEKQIFRALHVLEALAPVDPVGSAEPATVRWQFRGCTAAGCPEGLSERVRGKWVSIWDHRPEAMVEAAD